MKLEIDIVGSHADHYQINIHETQIECDILWPIDMACDFRREKVVTDVCSDNIILPDLVNISTVRHNKTQQTATFG